MTLKWPSFSSSSSSPRGPHQSSSWNPFSPRRRAASLVSDEGSHKPAVNNSLHHVFYGHSPFGERISALRGSSDAAHNIKPDNARIDFIFEIDGKQYILAPQQDSVLWKEEIKRSADPTIKHWVDTFYPLLHSDHGLASQSMGFAHESVKFQHEKIQLGATVKSVKHKCVLQVKSGSVYVIDEKQFDKCNFTSPDPKTIERDDRFLNSTNVGGAPLAKIKFVHHYVHKDSQKYQESFFDFRRRFFSHVLTVPNIDNMLVFSHAELAETFIEIFNAPKPLIDTSDDIRSSFQASISSFISISIESRASTPALFPSTASLRKENSTIEIASGFPEAEDLERLMPIEIWNRVFLETVKQSEKDRYFQEVSYKNWALILEANDIEISREYSQYAIMTQKEIEASIFNELVFLHYVQFTLNKNLDIWKKVENQIGLKITLSRYLENLHSIKEADMDMLEQFKSFLAEEFNIAKFYSITTFLIEKFKHQRQVVNAHYQDLNHSSPEMTWEKVKIALKETTLIKQLGCLGYFMPELGLQDLANQCEQSFSPSVPRVTLQRLLERNFAKAPFLVGEVIKKLQEITISCEHAYRNNFCDTIDAFAVVPGDEHPFLVHARKTVFERLEYLDVCVKYLQMLNTYYTLQECIHHFPEELKSNIASVIEQLENCQDFEGIEKEQERIIEKFQKFLTEQSEKVRSNFFSQLQAKQSQFYLKSINVYINALFPNILDISQPRYRLNDPEGLLHYYDDIYYVSREYAQFYVHFKRNTTEYLNHVHQKTAGGLSSDKYIQGLILQHFYVSLSSDYCEDYPTSFPGEVLTRDFLQLEILLKEHADNYFSNRIHAMTLASAIKDPSDAALSYIAALARSLQQSLGDSSSAENLQVVTCRICIWLAALVNKHLLEQNEITFCYNEISRDLACLPVSSSDSRSFFQMKFVWDEYLRLDKLLPRALEEWRQTHSTHDPLVLEASCSLIEDNEPGPLRVGDMSFHFLSENSNRRVLGQLADEGYAFFNVQTLMSENAATGVPDVLKKTLWQRVAEQLFKHYKESQSSGENGKQHLSLKSSKRLSGEVSNDGIERTEPKKFPEISEDYMAEILVVYAALCLSASVSRYKKAVEILGYIDAINPYAGIGLDILKCVDQQYSTNGHFSADDSIAQAILFSNEKSKIFLENEFEKTILDKLNSGELSINSVFEGIKYAFSNFLKLLKLDRNPLSPRMINGLCLPGFMQRLFTAFSVSYQYLTTRPAQTFVARNIVELWKECIASIRAIAGTNEMRHSQQYCNFANAWEAIGQYVFSTSCSESELRAPLIRLKQKPNLYDLVLAYDVCLDFNNVGFNMKSAITIILEQWETVTGYSITVNEVKALWFILKPQGQQYYGKLAAKLENISEFLTHGVAAIQRLGTILCVQVKNDYLLSSYLSSEILPVEIQENFWLSRGRFSSRRKNSLDQVSIDLAKVYMARSKEGRDPMEYPVIFFYQPSLKTLWNRYRCYERDVVRCVDVYWNYYEVVRQDCFVSDSRPLFAHMRSESSWASRAAANIVFAQQSDSSSLILVGNIRYNSDVLVKTHIFPEFFNLVLQCIWNSTRFMKRMHTPSSSEPISVAFLTPSTAIFYDPRALLHCDENALIGLFILGWIYETIEQQENQLSTVLQWLNLLPFFFADASNVRKLATRGIVNSTILERRYGSSGKDDPIEQALRTLDENLKDTRSKCVNRQQAYCDFYKKKHSETASSISVSVSNDSFGSVDAVTTTESVSAKSNSPVVK